MKIEISLRGVEEAVMADEEPMTPGTVVWIKRGAAKGRRAVVKEVQSDGRFRVDAGATVWTTAFLPTSLSLSPPCPHGDGWLIWVDDQYLCPGCGDEWARETVHERWGVGRND